LDRDRWRFARENSGRADDGGMVTFDALGRCRPAAAVTATYFGFFGASRQ
jgi:hypothetical protein